MSGRRGGGARRSGRSGGRGGSRGSGRGGGPKYPRSARVGQTLREIIADELVRIDDERLAFVTVTDVDVDDELNRAVVFFDSLDGEDGDGPILDALASHRVRLQSSIAKQIRAKKTPILDFQPDAAIRAAERIDEILRADRRRTGGDDGMADDPAPDAASDTAVETAGDAAPDIASDTGSDTGDDTGDDDPDE